MVWYLREEWGHPIIFGRGFFLFLGFSAKFDHQKRYLDRESEEAEKRYFYPSFVLSLNLSSVFKFNLSRAKQSLPKISTKFLSVCPSVCLSVRPSVQKIKPSFVGEIFLGGTEKLII
jgi:hypothetical protein